MRFRPCASMCRAPFPPNCGGVDARILLGLVLSGGAQELGAAILAFRYVLARHMYNGRCATIVIVSLKPSSGMCDVPLLLGWITTGFRQLHQEREAIQLHHRGWTSHQGLFVRLFLCRIEKSCRGRVPHATCFSNSKKTRKSPTNAWDHFH